MSGPAPRRVEPLASRSKGRWNALQRGMTSQQLQIEIREYREGDAPRLAQLFYESVRGLGPRRYSPDQVAAWAPKPPDPVAVHTRATDGRTTLVALDTSGEVVGYGDLESNVHIDHLYCSPDAAGVGVASMLLGQLVERAVGTGMPTLHVEASELARGLFERMGFGLVRRREFALAGVIIHNYAMERALA